jgi:hypothetical protein
MAHCAHNREGAGRGLTVRLDGGMQNEDVLAALEAVRATENRELAPRLASPELLPFGAGGINGATIYSRHPKCQWQLNPLAVIVCTADIAALGYGGGGGNDDSTNDTDEIVVAEGDEYADYVEFKVHFR